MAVDGHGMATLYIGREQWPFPLRLVKAEAGWSFDVEAGREEMLDRRIGRDELDVMELMRANARVQSRFRQTDYDGDGVMEFAASMLSSPGARDGLDWPPDGSPTRGVCVTATKFGPAMNCCSMTSFSRAPRSQLIGNAGTASGRG